MTKSIEQQKIDNQDYQGKHGYDVEIASQTYVYVSANNRAQAAARVKATLGTEARSVNFTG